ncbi:DUF2252 domain-containing protein [Streptomyces sp. NBC_00390]|uniref:DUF2252 domain-containing protein n=1 Tax=Streptomyces sp. NBC_00390 TaxID=2975736 RepID=UPI002E1F622D
MARSGHAGFDPSAHRPDPVEVLERQSAMRVPELVPIRYGRMLQSEFHFYRGAAAVMAADLGAEPDTRLTAQLCGDAHPLNFGLFASPERNLLFDINDFDETLPGPWEWDVKRLAAGFAIAGRGNGFTVKQRTAVVRATAQGYREAMRRFAGMRNLDVWYARTEVDQLGELMSGRMGERARRRLDRTTAKARTRDSLQAFEKLTEIVNGVRRITPDAPFVVPLADLLPAVERDELKHRLGALVERYGRTLSSDRRHLLGQFDLVDVARKVVGVGSVGTRCWILLMLGRDDQDPLLLQVKEAGESVLAPYAGASAYENQGQRVVAGQRLIQAAGDIFLGWEQLEGIDGRPRDFHVRQLRDWKGSPRPDVMTPGEMRLLGELCGTTLARGHARSGDRIAIASYLGGADTFDRAMGEFAEAYADQNERDHQALAAAAGTGRITVRTG